MSRYKNALRKHYIQPYEDGVDTPDEESWMRLAKYISDISPNNDEDTEEEAFYHGDGTPETTVNSISKGYDVEGQRFYGDEAQDYIADELAFDETKRKVWHRIVRADGKKEFVGKATISDVVTDGGPAEDYEEFGCTITFDEKPKVTDLEDDTGE